MGRTLIKHKWLRSCAILSVLFVAMPTWALTVNVTTAPLVTPSSAWTYYGSSTTHTAGLLAWTSAARPVEIKELARALGATRYTADVYSQTVYEYVRNNIQIEFRFGLSKGARGALIDQSGTAFDQVHLMVELLREGNVTASYQVGTITLNATQFSAWTGFTNAKAACQFLADGGIPATVNSATTCSSLSGTASVSTVVMGHAWVSANSKLYDPAYKQHIIKTGVDLAAAMGCGTATAPTCGSTILNFMPGITTSSGVNAIQGSAGLQSSIDNQVKSYGTNLETWIKNYNGTNKTSMQIEDLVGGRIIDLQAAFSIKTSSTPLPYTLTAQYTWAGDIPDAFRTTLRVQLDNIDKTLYVDEEYGRRLRLWGYENSDHSANNVATERDMALYSEYKPLARSNVAYPSNPASMALTLTVNHPYAANTGSYADEAIGKQVSVPDYCNSGQLRDWCAGTVTILQSWGDTTQSTISHFGALQQNDEVAIVPEDQSDPNHLHLWIGYDGFNCAATTTIPASTIAFNTCYEGQQSSIVATWLTQSSRINELTAQINQGRVQSHHSLGYAMSGKNIYGGVFFLNAQTNLSTNSLTVNANDRQAMVNMIAAVSSRLEGGTLEQMQDVWEAGSSISLLSRANAANHVFVEINSTNQTAAFGMLSSDYTSPINVKAALQSYVNLGYTVIAPTDPRLSYPFANGSGTLTMLYNGAVATKPDGSSAAYVVKGDGSGGSSGDQAADPATTTLNAVKQMEASVKDKKYYGINLQSGTLTLTPPPDLVTGSGTFPYSLSFQRYYDSAEALQGSASEYPPFRPAELGGGWKQNSSITARNSGDGLAGMGRDAAVHAAGAVAGMYVLRGLNSTGTIDMRGRLCTAFATNGWVSNLQNNLVTVERPPKTTMFVRSMDGTTFNPPPGSTEKLTQTGARYWAGLGSSWETLWDTFSVSLSLAGTDGSTLAFGGLGFDGDRYSFLPTTWSFPDGIQVAFNYTSNNLSSGLPANVYGCLTSVTNTLGRALNFPCQSQGISWVQDENGRQVTFASEDPITHATGTNYAAFVIPTKFSVTTPDGAITRYDYVQYPNTAINRDYAKIYRWFTPDDANTPFMTADYDSLYRVKGVTDKSGNRTDYFSSGLYGSENQKRGEVKDPLTALTTSYFDKNSNLLSVINPLGLATYHTYDSARRLTKTKYPEGNSTQYTYDARSNKLSTTSTAKSGSTYGTITMESATYPTSCSPATSPACNKPLTTTDANGNVTSYYYLSNGQLQRTVGPSVTNGVSGNAQTDYCYTSYGSVSLMTGKIDKVSSSENGVASYAYNSGNKYVLSSATVDPSTTWVPPGTAGNACTTTSKSGALALTTGFTFDGVGNVTAIDKPRTDVTDITTYNFDVMRRLTRVVSPAVTINGASVNPITRYTYNTDGTLLTTRHGLIASPTDSNPSNPWPTDLVANQWQTDTRSYYPTGDLQSVMDAEGSLTQYGYDAIGRQTLVTDPDGRRTGTVYDLAGQTRCVWKGWDSATAPAAWLNSSSTVCNWTPSSYTGSGKYRYAQYDYTNNGKQYWVQDANNNETDYAYDGLDRLQFTLFPNAADGTRCSRPATDSLTPTCSASGGTTPTYEKYTYDSAGNRLTLRTRKAETITSTYDAMNRLKTKAPQSQGTVSYGYNLLGEQLSVAEAASGSYAAYTTSYTYDAVGRKISEQTNPLAGSAKTVSYQYDQAGNRSQTTWPDNYYVSYSYDALNRMQYVRENSTSTNELAFYDYDIVGRRKTLCLGGQSTSCLAGNGTNKTTYSYEADSDLSTLTNVLNATSVNLTYGHNHSHQLTNIAANDDFYLVKPVTTVSTAYVSNNLNQYGSVGGQAATYDANGNMLTWYPTDGSGKNTYTYDSENRLVTAAVKGSASATLSFDYDALGRRMKKADTATTTTYYLLDGDEEIAEYSSAGVLQRRYITGPAIDDRIARVEGNALTNPTKYYYHTNHQGSVMDMTDASGSITQQLAYDEYGKLTSQPPAAITGEPFRYTGRRYDTETNLYYYRARYYTPDLGRFLQVDPIGYKDDVDLYTYVGNDPLDKTDPSGRCLEDACIVEAALIVDALIYTGLISGPTVMQAEAPAATPAAAPTATPANSPGLPSGLVGTQDSKAGQQGNRHNSGPLSPDNGGTGNSKADFNKLTGGRSAPAPEGSNYPPGTQVGENGISHRPEAGSTGPRIDVPANGAKPAETLHYPPGNASEQPKPPQNQQQCSQVPDVGSSCAF